MKESIFKNKKEYDRARYLENRESVKKKSLDYYRLNKEDAKKKRKERYIKNKEKILKQNKEYRQAHKQQIYEHHKEKMKTNTNYMLASNLRRRLLISIKKQCKSGSAVSDLGCSIEQLKLYLESAFKPGMSWENYGRGGWHIDHIIPLVSFDLTDRKQFLEACHYTNLQPLWEKENLSKGANYVKA